MAAVRGASGADTTLSRKLSLVDELGDGTEDVDGEEEERRRVGHSRVAGWTVALSIPFTSASTALPVDGAVAAPVHGCDCDVILFGSCPWLAALFCAVWLVEAIPSASTLDNPPLSPASSSTSAVSPTSLHEPIQPASLVSESRCGDMLLDLGGRALALSDCDSSLI